jgi:hypothetical protein
MLRTKMLGKFFATIAFCGTAFAQDQVDPALTEVWDPEPAVVTPGMSSTPPSDDFFLLGDDLAEWPVGPDQSVVTDRPQAAADWNMVDGVLTVGPGKGGIQTRKDFGSVQLHIEWRAPVMKGDSQAKGNSGIFLQKRYEVQVLDSYQNRTYSNGQAASIYKQHIPLVNASRPPGQWQSYDIVFAAPQFDDHGMLTRPAYITVFQNGVLVQNHVEIKGLTVYRGDAYYEVHDNAPLSLQDHGDLVSYRNIWIREL